MFVVLDFLFCSVFVVLVAFLADSIPAKNLVVITFYLSVSVSVLPCSDLFHLVKARHVMHVSM